MIILHLTLTPWDSGQVMSRQSLATALSLFCTNIYQVILSSALSDLIHGGRESFWRTSSLRKQKRNLYIGSFSPWLGTVYKSKAINKIQIWRQARILNNWIRKLRDDEKVVLYCWNYEGAQYIDYIYHDYLVYHIYDDYFSYTQKEIPQEAVTQEQILIDKADLLIINTYELAEKKKINRDWLHIPGGVNTELFYKRARLPSEFSSLKNDQKTVGYFGMINDKIDFDLLLKLVTSAPEYRFLFAGIVGNMAEKNKKKWELILSNSNVLHLGQRSQEEIACLCNIIDVGFMPYVTDKNWAQFIFPLKFFEFLACGKPVVGTPISSLRPYENIIYLVNTAQQMRDKIEMALKTDSIEKQQSRIRLAQQNSWNNRAEKILNAIEPKVRESSL